MATSHLSACYQLAGLCLLMMCASGCRATSDWVASYRSSARKADSVAANHLLGQSNLPSEIKPEEKTNIRLTWARAMERQGKIDDAQKAYSRIIDEDDKNPEALRRLAVIYDKKGEGQKSADLYRRALKLAPTNAQIYCDFGYSCYLQEQRGEAEKYLRQAVRLQPEMARAHNNLGLVLAGAGKDKEALAEFALGGCQKPEARVNLALALLSQRQWNRAEQEFRRALALDPFCTAAKKGLSHVLAVPAEIRQGEVLGVHREAPVVAKRAAPKNPPAAPEAAPAASLIQEVLASQEQQEQLVEYAELATPGFVSSRRPRRIVRLPETEPLQ